MKTISKFLSVNIVNSRQQANRQTTDGGWKKGQGKCETHATSSMTITK